MSTGDNFIFGKIIYGHLPTHVGGEEGGGLGLVNLHEVDMDCIVGCSPPPQKTVRGESRDCCLKVIEMANAYGITAPVCLVLNALGVESEAGAALGNEILTGFEYGKLRSSV